MDTTITHSPCANNYYQCGENRLCRDITTWNLNNEYTVPPTLLPNANATLIFTNTMPKCYAPDTTGTGRDTCNIVFNAWRYASSGSTNATLELRYTLNGDSIGNCYLSGVAQHGATQAFDLGNTAVTQYNDPGENTFIIHNASTSTIQLDHVKIYRTYKMCNTTCVNNECAGHPLYECQCPKCVDGYTICSGGHPYGTNGPFDNTREDTPCNSLTCGGLSYTQWHDTSKLGETLLSYGRNALSWTFDFSTLSHGHTGKSICLFNFNYIEPASTSGANDIEIVALLNGYTVNNYYLSKYSDKGLYPSYDLAQAPSGASYDDTGLNTVSLKNLGSTNVRMDDSSGGGIDIYRIYQSTPICDYPCQSGQTECPTCECGCETCQETCQVSCQTSCEVSCQMCYGCVACYLCYVGCQEGCEAECQDCQTTCEISCQTGCELCQDTCQLSCQGCYGCYTCQACEAGCQQGEGSCEPYCYACQSCMTCESCQASCQTCQDTCQISCQETCQISCQTCNTTCQSTCETTCQACEAGCQQGEGGCEPYCYACQSCMTCESGQS